MTIDDVRAAEKRVQVLIAEDSDSLNLQLQKATDEYAKAVRELW